MSFQNIKELVKNLSEKLEGSNQENEKLKEENKELKNNLRKLIGEQELPEFKSKKKSKKSNERDPNSEYKQPRKKGGKKGKRAKRKHKIKVDRQEKLKIDKSTLPSDAEFKGHRSVIIQEIEFRTDNVEFLIPRYYSPSLKKYFEAPLPSGFKGHEFGPKLRSFILMLNVQARVTENKIQSILNTLGIMISTGHVNNITQTIPQNILHEMLEAKDIAIEKGKMFMWTLAESTSMGMRATFNASAINFSRGLVCLKIEGDMRF